MQHAQIRDLAVNLEDMQVDEVVDAGARLVRLILEPEQDLYFVEGYAQ